MRKATLYFNRCEIGSFALGTGDDHHISKVYFDYEVAGMGRRSLVADVKQTVGEHYERGPLEVSLPIEYSGLVDHAEFQQRIDQYYRSVLGKAGRGISVDETSSFKGIGITIEFKATAVIAVPDEALGW
jgi:hypothetical protein